MKGKKDQTHGDVRMGTVGAEEQVLPAEGQSRPSPTEPRARGAEAMRQDVPAELEWGERGCVVGGLEDHVGEQMKEVSERDRDRDMENIHKTQR